MFDCVVDKSRRQAWKISIIIKVWKLASKCHSEFDRNIRHKATGSHSNYFARKIGVPFLTIHFFYRNRSYPKYFVKSLKFLRLGYFNAFLCPQKSLFKHLQSSVFRDDNFSTFLAQFRWIKMTNLYKEGQRMRPALSKEYWQKTLKFPRNEIY